MSDSFKAVADLAQAEAIAEKLSPTNDGTWRSICRAYSKKYSTPLHLVVEMAPEFILQHHYEGEFEDVDLEEHLDQFERMIRMIEDPNYVQEEAEELDDFIEKAERDEEERLAKGKPIHRAMKGGLNSLQEASIPETELPKQGFVDFTKLNQDNET